MSIGFDRDRGWRQRELTHNKTQKNKFHVGIVLQVVPRFAEHQEKATHELGYKLTLTRNTDNAVLNKDNAISNAKIKITAIDWYVPHCTPSVPKQAILSKQILSKTPT